MDNCTNSGMVSSNNANFLANLSERNHNPKVNKYFYFEYFYEIVEVP